MNRRKIVVANWKMNLDFYSTITLINELLEAKITNTDVVKIICPPFIYLQPLSEMIKNSPIFYLGAQNCSEYKSGPYTGEISAMMLASINCKYVIIGHSERRQCFNEANACLTLKIKQTIANNMQPIFCVGETIEERQNNTHFTTVSEQLFAVLNLLTEEDLSKIIIGYEPIWAIGKGKTATPDDAQAMHLHIRNWIKTNVSEKIANQIPILYGGSCNAKNAKELFLCPDIDGGLVGGASLVASDFCSIVNAF